MDWLIENCPSGTFFDLNNGSCVDCPHDTFNPSTGQVGQCRNCPEETYTLEAGSKNSSQCLGRYNKPNDGIDTTHVKLIDCRYYLLKVQQ